jgi:dipeptide/tripeptide permease
MGSWFLIASATASAISAKIANYASVPAGSENDTTVLFHTYGSVFQNIGIAALVAAALFFALGPMIKKLAGIK